MVVEFRRRTLLSLDDLLGHLHEAPPPQLRIPTHGDRSITSQAIACAIGGSFSAFAILLSLRRQDCACAVLRIKFSIIG